MGECAHGTVAVPNDPKHISMIAAYFQTSAHHNHNNIPIRWDYGGSEG